MVRMDYGMVGKEIFLNKLEASKQWKTQTEMVRKFLKGTMGDEA